MTFKESCFQAILVNRKPSNFPKDHKAANCQTFNWKAYLVWFCWPAQDCICWFWTTSKEPVSSKIILLIPIITLLHLTEFFCFHLCFQKQKLPALLFWRMLHILRWQLKKKISKGLHIFKSYLDIWVRGDRWLREMSHWP